MANETSNGNGANATAESQVAMVIIAMVYLVIFVTSELGNGFVIFSLLVRKRRRGRTAMDDFVLSLSTTDFLFTTSSLVFAVEYLLDEWKLGVAVCKIEGQLVEVTYIVSTLTMTTISYTRYKAANAENPFKLFRQKPTARRNIALIWLFSLVFSLPMLHGYTVVRRGGSLHCTNLNFNEVTRRTYYLILAILLFVIPITVMIVSQYKITSGLRSHSRSQATGVMTSAAISTRVAVYEQRVTKLLTLMWIIFMCCCAPFTTYRTLDYFVHIRKRGEVSNQLWELCQMLIILNAAINPFLYHRMMKNGLGDRTKARCVEWCCCIRHGGQDHVDVSASNQEQIEIKNKTRGGVIS